MLTLLTTSVDKTTQTNPTPTRQPQQAHCPSCGKFSTFTFAGEQRVPPKVAKATGLPPVFSMWHCSACESTLSEPDLRF